MPPGLERSKLFEPCLISGGRAHRWSARARDRDRDCGSGTWCLGREREDGNKDGKTARQQDSKAARQQDSKTARQQDSKITREAEEKSEVGGRESTTINHEELVGER
jgi:hypothetical protein